MANGLPRGIHVHGVKDLDGELNVRVNTDGSLTLNVTLLAHHGSRSKSKLPTCRDDFAGYVDVDVTIPKEEIHYNPVAPKGRYEDE